MWSLTNFIFLLVTLSGNGLLPGLAKQVVVLYQQYQKADRFFGYLGELEEVIISTEMLQIGVVGLGGAVEHRAEGSEGEPQHDSDKELRI